jgi:pyridoxamine 5'-phosphate oxidase
MDDINDFLASDRRSFEYGRLHDGHIPTDPIALFEQWLKEALDRQNPEAYAFVLMTKTENDFPSGRMVYLRALEPDGGLVFFSNYTSNKAKQIDQSNKVGALFFWPMNERQIRITGTVSRAPEEVSDAYFAGRPRESQIGAWASEQSSAIESRKTLEDRVEHFTRKFEGQPIPRPGHWGGYLILPEQYEFWQGRQSRLHDRILYKRTNDVWEVTRLSP